MALEISEHQIGNILTRTSGFLKTVCSHSLQPYRGCTYGNSLCGVACYVRHSAHLHNGRDWGSYLDVRMNAADSYRKNADREARWARRSEVGSFSIFCSSSTDPFVPQERKYGVTRSVLEAMIEQPPDELILQTHSHRVADYVGLYETLVTRCRLRIHISIESDRDRLPGLPPPASSVERRIEAAGLLRGRGLSVTITVSPLLPIAKPVSFFERLAEVADAVVLDHFVGGDGSRNGARTRRTDLPTAMRAVEARSVELSYRDEMAAIAEDYFPGRVGIGIDGFAARFEPGGAPREPG